MSQPAGSRHLEVLVDADLAIATRGTGWMYDRRNEAALAAVAQRIAAV